MLATVSSSDAVSGDMSTHQVDRLVLFEHGVGDGHITALCHIDTSSRQQLHHNLVTCDTHHSCRHICLECYNHHQGMNSHLVQGFDQF